MELLFGFFFLVKQRPRCVFASGKGEAGDMSQCGSGSLAVAVSAQALPWGEGVFGQNSVQPYLVS